jgi:hypothetical protein
MAMLWCELRRAQLLANKIQFISNSTSYAERCSQSAGKAETSMRKRIENASGQDGALEGCCVGRTPDHYTCQISAQYFHLRRPWNFISQLHAASNLWSPPSAMCQSQRIMSRCRRTESPPRQKPTILKLPMMQVHQDCEIYMSDAVEDEEVVLTAPSPAVGEVHVVGSTTSWCKSAHCRSHSCQAEYVDNEAATSLRQRASNSKTDVQLKALLFEVCTRTATGARQAHEFDVKGKPLCRVCLRHLLRVSNKRLTRIFTGEEIAVSKRGKHHNHVHRLADVTVTNIIDTLELYSRKSKTGHYGGWEKPDQVYWMVFHNGEEMARELHRQASNGFPVLNGREDIPSAPPSTIQSKRLLEHERRQRPAGSTRPRGGGVATAHVVTLPPDPLQAGQPKQLIEVRTLLRTVFPAARLQMQENDATEPASVRIVADR